ncbi:hypothetical protein [Catellatospora citrea]|uniref:PemK-like, MazF-like toxin of type II toxin-antitoxin system n=1 Tax=Catellatospora citrea TaxID=53366 RepID=A0A8J3NY57_9ACTN|nr:hypothetical protein [Catellatospora citrea]RKE05774.1 hypothetical protein C8E86_0584 [Catellatospora citrea]GIF97135.1 hypothetical protein Cci01nite_22290 [Catellatospora citrea]
MARRSNPSGCGCILLILVGPFLVSLAVSVPGTVLASPAVVAFLLARDPEQIAVHPSWWAGAALAPLVAYLVVRLAGRGRVYARHRIHLVRAGVLTVLCAGTALLAMVLYQQHLDATTGATPPAPAGPQPLTLETSLALVGPVAAGTTALLCYFVLRLLDRRLPRRSQDAPHTQTAPAWLEPRPQEIWWGEIEFRDGVGAKDRPFVVLRALPHHLEVLQITSQDKAHRDDHLPFWTDSDDPYAVDDGYLELRVRQVNKRNLRRRDAAYCPDQIWHRVRSIKATDPPQARS